VADPTVIHTAWLNEVDEDGDIIQEAIFTNLNDAHALKVDGQSLVGRSDADNGIARKITVVPPLALVDGELLEIDPGAIASEARVAALEAQVAANTPLIASQAARIAALEAINAAARIAALETTVASLQQQLNQLRDTVRTFPSAQVALAGTGAVVLALTVSTMLRPTLAGTGAMVAPVTRIRFLSAAFGGTAAGTFNVIPLSANMSMFAHATANVPDVIVVLIPGIKAALAGTAALACDGIVGRVASAAFAATSSLAVNAIIGKFLAPPAFVLVSTLSVTASQRSGLQTAFAGSGVGNWSGSDMFDALARTQAALAGTAVLALDITQKSPFLNAALAGAATGNWNITSQIQAARGILVGAGAVTSSQTQRAAARGTLAGAGAIAGNVTPSVKSYVEFFYAQRISGTPSGVGVARSTSALNTYPGGNLNSWGVQDDGAHYGIAVSTVTTSSTSSAAGDHVGFAWDGSNIYAHVGGQWWNGSAFSGTLLASTAIATGVTGPLFPMASVASFGTSAIWQFIAAGSETYKPSGYSSWTGAFNPSDKDTNAIISTTTVTNDTISVSVTGVYAGARGTVSH